MKKVLAVFLCVVMSVCVFCACSKKDGKNDDSKDAKTTSSSAMTTDSAVIKEADAINLVQSYSDDELGLTAKQRKEVSFMVAGEGVEIEGKNYIEVVATIKEEHKDGDKVSYTFNHLGMYYISYDGKKIMRKDMDSKDAKYIDMKIKAVPTTTSPAETHSEEEKSTEGENNE